MQVGFYPILRSALNPLIDMIQIDYNRYCNVAMWSQYTLKGDDDSTGQGFNCYILPVFL